MRCVNRFGSAFRLLAAVPLVALFAAACSNGGSGGRDEAQPPPTVTSTAPTTTTLPPSTTTTVRPPPRVPTADDPLRVLILGDSIMYDAAFGIEAALEATGVAEVERQAVLGFGFDSTYDWRSAYPGLFEEYRPEVIVIMMGGWDAHLVDQNGSPVYVALVDEAVGVMRSQGAEILWLSYPHGQPDADRTAARVALNEVFAALPARWPGVVTYIDIGPVLGNPDGTWAQALPGPDGALQLVRKPDGGHICPYGSQLLGDAVRDTLTPLWGLSAPNPAWVLGEWRSVRAYNDPPGACDG